MSLLQSWADAPATGAYQEQEIGETVRQAVEQMVWLPLAKREPISSGQSVTVPLRGRLAEPTSDLLTESVSIPLDKLTISAKVITLQERGRGLKISRKNINRSPIDLLAEHRMAIAEQMSLSFDKRLSEDGFQSGQLKYAPTGAASFTLATSGSFTAAALSNVNFYHITKLRDLAYRTYLMPKMDNGKYVYVSSTAGIRGIMDDPKFIQINAPQNASKFESNLVGTIHDVEIREENHTLSDSVGTNSDVAEGVFIANDAVRYAMIQSPQIYFDQTEDFGRFMKLAWYGDFGVGPSTDSSSAGFARLIHVGST